MSTPIPAVGVDAFEADLRRCAVDVARQADVVTFTVEAMTAAGPRTVQTGVGVGELSAWPAVPPHWVHFPGTVEFAHSNINPAETLPGWVRHSRDVQNWGDAAEPGQAWLAHVRSILQDAK